MYDLLSCATHLRRHLERVSSSDVQVFSYLGCLLAVYSGVPVVDWEYGFTGTELGAPFSESLVSALSAATNAGWIRIDPSGHLTLTTEGLDELRMLEGLQTCNWRGRFIEGSIISLLSLPAGLIKAAIGQEPTLRPVTQTGSARRLLEGPALELLYQQFEDLAQAVGTGLQDLMLPSTVWLSYLAKAALEQRLPNDDQ